MKPGSGASASRPLWKSLSLPEGVESREGGSRQTGKMRKLTAYLFTLFSGLSSKRRCELASANAFSLSSSFLM